MAKKFRFRLEGVRRVRAQERDARRREVADAARAVTSAEQRIEELNNELQATMQHTQSEQKQARLDVALLRGHQFRRNHLHRRIIESHAALASKKHELNACRAKLAEASKRLKAIEKLREKQWNRHLTEVRREEQTAGDEVAAQRYLRARAETACEG